MHFRIKDATKKAYICRLYESSSIRAIIYIDNDNLYYFDGSVHNIGDINDKQWYTLKVQFSCADNEMDIYLDESLIKEDGGRTSTSYARYLMSCHLGRYLDEDEHVDHINEDPLDDRVENLQILTLKENHSKSKPKHLADIRCPICKKIFTRRWSQTFIQKKDKPYQTCSRTCGGKASHINPKKLEEDCEIVEEYWK